MTPYFNPSANCDVINFFGGWATKCFSAVLEVGPVTISCNNCPSIADLLFCTPSCGAT